MKSKPYSSVLIWKRRQKLENINSTLIIFIFYFGFRLTCLVCKDIWRNSYLKNASSLIKCHTTLFACFFLLLIFVQKYHFCHHFMVNITYNPTINLFCFYAPPMGHSFNLFLHQPLIPPLDQQTSCHFTDFHPTLFNRFHLAG